MSTSVSAISFAPPSVNWTSAGLALAVFMYVLDGTIANVSLPTIAGNLGANSSQSAWVITSFVASNAIALPLTGFLVRRIGQLPLFLWSMGLFTVASLLCGLAMNMEMLILCRVLQGAVAGPLIPTTQALMLSIYPPEKRGYALSMIAMITVVAPIAGPLLGGWITDNYSWRWAFLINIPVGIFACLLVANQMRGRPENKVQARVDLIGLAALIVGVGALQILLDKGNEEDWFNSGLIVILTITAVVTLAFFIIWELTEPQPIVNLHLFRQRNFRVGTLALVFAYSAFYAINVIVPLWLQQTLGYTPIWAGFAVAPMGVLPLLLMSFMGKYAPRFNMRWLVSVAFVLLAFSSFLRSGFVIDIDFQHIALIQLLQGLGLALFIMPINTILLSDLKPDEIAAGSGLATFMRTLGASLAVSITTLLWDRRSIMHHARLGESLTPYDQETRQAVTILGQGYPQQGNQLLDNLVTEQATQLAFNDVSYALAGVFLIAIVLVWFAKPPFIPRAK